MSAVFDALGTAVALSLMSWLVIMLPVSAALAHRLGWSPAYGALLALIPIPFLSWIIVAVVATRKAERGLMPLPQLESDSGSSDWMDLEGP